MFKEKEVTGSYKRQTPGIKFRKEKINKMSHVEIEPRNKSPGLGELSFDMNLFR